MASACLPRPVASRSAVARHGADRRRPVAQLDAGRRPFPPSRGVTLPKPDKAGAYSWCKAPRLDGAVVEVGALARQVVDGHPLVRDLVAASGGNVRNRVVARLPRSPAW